MLFLSLANPWPAVPSLLLSPAFPMWRKTTFFLLGWNNNVIVRYLMFTCPSHIYVMLHLWWGGGWGSNDIVRYITFSCHWHTYIMHHHATSGVMLGVGVGLGGAITSLYATSCSLTLNIHTSRYFTSCSLVLSIHTSCYATSCSRDLNIHLSCYATSCSFVHNMG